MNIFTVVFYMSAFTVTARIVASICRVSPTPTLGVECLLFVIAIALFDIGEKLNRKK